MGFISDMFGGTTKAKVLPAITDPRALEFQSELYPQIEGGLRGGGLTPQITAGSVRDMLAATDVHYQDLQGDTESMLHRNVPWADMKVRGYVKDEMQQQYARKKENIRELPEWQNYADLQAAQNMAMGAVGAEKGVASKLTGMANESAFRRYQDPNFLSSLSGGLGGAAGILAAGKFAKFSDKEDQSSLGPEERYAFEFGRGMRLP